jgi:hypothetical protein
MRSSTTKSALIRCAQRGHCTQAAPGAETNRHVQDGHSISGMDASWAEIRQPTMSAQLNLP